MDMNYCWGQHSWQKDVYIYLFNPLIILRSLSDDNNACLNQPREIMYCMHIIIVLYIFHYKIIQL